MRAVHRQQKPKWTYGFASFFRRRAYESHSEPPADEGLPYENIWLQTADGVRLHGWLIPHIDAPATILFFHGNAGNVADRLENARLLYEAGWQVFLLDYRGFGQSEGTPNEQGTYHDARATWEWARDELGGTLVLFGRSLGGAVAIWLAAQPDVSPVALIVENTFTRGRDIARQILPIPGVVHLLPDFYPSIDRIKQIRCPKLIIHGEADDIITTPISSAVMPTSSGFRLSSTHTHRKQPVAPWHRPPTSRFGTIAPIAMGDRSPPHSASPLNRRRPYRNAHRMAVPH